VFASVDDANYVGSINGLFTIVQDSATVMADNKVIRYGNPLPPFTSTFSGFVNGENQSVVTSLTYTLNPTCVGSPGIYQIMPSATAANYLFTPVNGTLYINPYGFGTKNVKVMLTCIDQIPPDPEGFTYIAHFKYTNSNNTPVFIPVGADNILSGNGSFSTSGQPELFMPGTGYWDVKFNGVMVKWTLKSYCNYTKTTSYATASSSSCKCNNKSSQFQDESVIPAELSDIVVYPNPTSGKVFIAVGDREIVEKDVLISDLFGRIISPEINKTAGNLLEVDFTDHAPGVYIIRLMIDNDPKLYRIIRK
jgi:hypothetical protein